METDTPTSSTPKKSPATEYKYPSLRARIVAEGRIKRAAALQELADREAKRAILTGRIDVLYSILGYVPAKSGFHGRLLRFGMTRRETLQLSPRRFGKTSAVTVTRSIFEIVRDRNVSIVIVSKAESQAKKILAEIKFHLEHNARLRRMFGEFVGEKWEMTEIIVFGRTAAMKEATVTCAGVGSAITGSGYRFAFVDDVIDRENSRTPVQRQNVEDWWKFTFRPTVDLERGEIHVLGTRYRPNDLYGKLEAGEMNGKVQRIDCFNEKGESVWPEQKPTTELLAVREKVGTLAFDAQWRNLVHRMAGSIIKAEWIDPHKWGSETIPVPDWSAMQPFVGCDPAATKRQQLESGSGETDWWAIVWGYIADDGRIYVRGAWRDRVTKDVYVSRVKRVADEIGAIAVGVEDVAAQEYICQDLERLGLPVRRVGRKNDKIARAYWMQPYFENGRVLLPGSPPEDSACRHLEDELLLFDGTGAEHDDLFDALETMLEVAVPFAELRNATAVVTPSVSRSIAYGDEWATRYGGM